MNPEHSTLVGAGAPDLQEAAVSRLPGEDGKGSSSESTEDEQKDGMNSMFESLMADFDKHETSANTPLYLR